MKIKREMIRFPIMIEKTNSKLEGGRVVKKSLPAAVVEAPE